MLEFRPILTLDAAALAPLLVASRAEGFRFVARLADDWTAGRLRFDGADEVLLGGYAAERLLAVGGVTRELPGGEPGVGRVRRVYALPAVRGQGIGRRLVVALEAWATGRYPALVLRTDTAAAARFYERLGYAVLAPGGTATHRKALGRPAV